jgi:hypothetical protein
VFFLSSLSQSTSAEFAGAFRIRQIAGRKGTGLGQFHSPMRGVAVFEPTRVEAQILSLTPYVGHSKSKDSTDDELIRANGKTYASTKMWGMRTPEAITRLLEKYADMGVSFCESST